ncbi:MAG: flavodoxin [Bacteroidales bacterium]|nr:flavodoxin [Bacteroidales bacterium]
MSKIAVFYGSTTGTCETLAGQIAEKLGTSDVFSAADLDAAKIADYDVLVLGSSTWGDGELQDDWYDAVETLKKADLSGKKVALFGCGDSASYPDTFCSAMGIIYEAVAGAKVIGQGISTDGYTFGASQAVVDGVWVGCAIDDVNESDQTAARIDAWVAKVKSEM